MLTPITITGTIDNPDGSLGNGAMMFQLVDGAGAPCGMVDSGTGQIITARVVAGVIVQGKLLWNSPGGGGYNPLVLLANDDPTTLPVGTAYKVTESLVAGSVGPWTLTVHHNAPAGTLDISSQRPSPS